jgi:hypothetical protein
MSDSYMRFSCHGRSDALLRAAYVVTPTGTLDARVHREAASRRNDQVKIIALVSE